MKNKDWIEEKVKELEQEIKDLNQERNHKKDVFGGISKEENDDFFHDISWNMAKIEALRDVLD